MSLEHEPNMYKKWAELLIAAGVNPNPIHQQFADILSNLNEKSANFLKEIYEKQTKPDIENTFNDYVEKIRFQKIYNEVVEHPEPNNSLTIGGIPVFTKPRIIYQANFIFPIIISGSKKAEVLHRGSPVLVEKEKAFVNAKNYLVLTNEDENMLLVLEKLDLIKYQFISHEQRKDEKGNYLFVENCGVLLTQFGYSFVDCLENPTK
jgi:hypothetical protein